MFSNCTTAVRAAFAAAVGAAVLVPFAGAAQGAPFDASQGSLDFDARIGECVALGGEPDAAVIERAACGSWESNYVVIGKAATSDQCVADHDGWYAESIDDVQVGALCLDYDWVLGGCMELGGDDPRRIDCREPAVEGVRVTEMLDGADASACASGVGYEYPQRHYVVCVEEF